ncbi:MAG: DUF4375 domain-containing protein [Clostridia bacterium]|nr:DUF4375 domain-containing protein [Clostridia bacterium]
MKCKRIIVFLLTLVMMASVFSVQIFAKNEITILLDGQELLFDVPPQAIDNRIMVPMRKIFESMGAVVEWDGSTQAITAIKGDTIVIMQIDNEVINVSGKDIVLDVPPQAVNSRTLVPARAVAESLNAKVDWDGDTQTVIIKYKTLQSEDNDMKINEIWNIEEKEDFVIEMTQYIAEKCEYGDKMEILNEEQRVLYIIQLLEMEVNNGGFAQFFFNSSGEFANELVSSFEKIGAIKTAEICKKAISVYGDEVPTDRDEREDIISPDDEKEEERIEEILNECDDAFFEYEENLVELNYQFIISNKASFLN